MTSSPRSSNLNQQPQSQLDLQQQQQHKQVQSQVGYPGLNSNLANLATGAGNGAVAPASSTTSSVAANLGLNGSSGNHPQNGVNGNQAIKSEITGASNLNGGQLNQSQDQQSNYNSSSSSSSIPLKNLSSNPSYSNFIDPTNADQSSISVPPPNNGKARQLDSAYLDFDTLMAQTEHVPLDLLEAEIPPADPPGEYDIIPLSAIVRRMANYGYDTFQNLTETLPSLSSDEKRTKIFHSALEMRKQFIKLLVLARWSKSALDLQKARDLVGLITDQHHVRQSATEELIATRRTLPFSRVRNYDLSTAIDVLSTGNYLRLPASIKDEVVPRKPFSDEEALEIVSELEDALRLRLSCYEILPLQMSNYSILNGRAHFKVKGLFDASITLSGSDDQDRFFLLSIKFDFRNTGLGKLKYKRSPEGDARAQIIKDGDAHLTPESPAVDRSEEIGNGQQQIEGNDPLVVPPPPPTTSGDIEQREKMDLDVESDGKQVVDAETMERKDGPLLRLYSFLQQTSLKYQLSILKYQAEQLSNLHWGNNLRVYEENNPVTLVIEYWTRNSTQTQRQIASNSRTSRVSTQSGNPVAQGFLRISIKEVETQSGTSATIENLLGSTLLNRSESDADLGKQFKLAVTWDLDESVAKEVDRSSIEIDSYDLNIESLLTSAISQHSLAAIRAFHKRVVSSSLGQSLDPRECSIEETIRQDGSISSVLKVRLCESFSVVLGLTSLSGRLFLKTHHERSADGMGDAMESEGIAARLSQATEKMNSNPSLLIEALQNLRFGGVLEELEQKADYLGLTSMRRVPLRTEDRVKFFGTSPSALLFIPLAQCPSYFIVPRVLPQNIRVGLVCILSVIEPSGQQTGLIQFMSWIDRPRILGGGGKRKRGEANNGAMRQDISIEEMSRLHSYCVALVGYLKIEEQLRLRGAPYSQVSPSKSYGNLASINPSILSNPAEDVASLVPSLCVLSKGLLGYSSGLSNPNVSIILREWWIPPRCHVQITLQLKLRSGVVNRSLTCDDGSEIHFDGAKSILTFTTKSVGDCVHRFLAHWNEISKIALLAREVSIISRNKFKKRGQGEEASPAPDITLQTFDLSSVQFKYSQNLSLSVKRTLSSGQGQPSFGRFALTFSSEGQGSLKSRRKANPHHLLTHSLERVLNINDDSSSQFWAGFLQLLHQTLPILREIAPFYDQALEDPDCPELEIFSATWYRLRILDRYAIDIHLVSGFRVLLSDASQAKFRNHIDSDSTLQGQSSKGSSALAPNPGHPSNHELHQSIPNFQQITSRITREFNQRLFDQKEKSQKRHQEGKGQVELLDLKSALLCSAREEIVRPVLRSLLGQVKKEIEKI